MIENKSVGLDNISPSLLRSCSTSVIFPLCNIINSSLDNGTFPSLWKTAKVFALHKGGSLSDFNNYRPISVLSVTSKIIERHVHDSFSSYLHNNSLLSDVQSGFRKSHSCFTCLTSMTSDWLNNINNNKLVGSVTLDFRKAFDVLSHDIILKKLALYGCDELTLSWFTSYLKNRFQLVQINGTKSESVNVKHGIPQGSILGPLLFIVFINDIIFQAKFSNLYIYADDTSISCYDTNVNSLNAKLNQDLNNIEKWCQKNQIVINTSKSKSMLICSHQKRSVLETDLLNVKLHNICLENVAKQNILGLIIDKNLSWKPHTDNLHLNLHSELSKLAGLLWRSRLMLPHSYKVLFYNSYILPKIDYCLPIWGGASQTHLNHCGKYKKDVWELLKMLAMILHPRNYL